MGAIQKLRPLHGVQSKPLLGRALDELHVAHLLAINLALLPGGVHQAVRRLHVDVIDSLLLLFLLPEADICARSLAIDRVLVVIFVGPRQSQVLIEALLTLKGAQR